MYCRNLSGKLRLSDASGIQLRVGHELSCGTAMLLQETKRNATVLAQALGTHWKSMLRCCIFHMCSLRAWPSAHWLWGAGSTLLMGSHVGERGLCFCRSGANHYTARTQLNADP